MCLLSSVIFPSLEQTKADTCRHVFAVCRWILNFLSVQNCNYFSLSLVASLFSPKLCHLSASSATTSQAFFLLCSGVMLISLPLLVFSFPRCSLHHLPNDFFFFFLLFIFAVCFAPNKVSRWFAGSYPVISRSDKDKTKMRVSGHSGVWRGGRKCWVEVVQIRTGSVRGLKEVKLWRTGRLGTGRT